MFKMNKYGGLVIFLVLGGISGLVSAIIAGADNLMSAGNTSIYYGPGIFFGIAICLGSLFFKKAEPIRMVFWVAASTLAYYIAVWVALFSERSPIAFPLAGFVGAFLVGGAFSWLFQTLTKRHLLMLTLLGTFLAIPQLYSSSGDFSMTTLISAWQAGIAGLLGYWMAKAKSIQRP